MKGGVLLVNKPRGISSYDVIRKIKREASFFKKIGHAGTLDPIAEGLLLILFDNATKLFPILTSYPKVYRAKIRLGVVTDTDDLTGEILERHPVKDFQREEIISVLKRYEGEIEQIPPIFSALKEKGLPQYLRARRKEVVSPRARKVKVFWINLLSWEKESLEIRTEVGKGTYIRALARDIGKALGCGGSVEELKRERIGKFRVEEAIPFSLLSEKVIKENCLSIESALYPFPEVTLEKEEIKSLLLGRKIPIRPNLEWQIPNGKHSSTFIPHPEFLKVFSRDRETLLLVKRLSSSSPLIKLVRVLYASSECGK
jgi:tRNA pseudouridine55 synthase